MDDFAALINRLDGLSLFVGAAVGVLGGIMLLMFSRFSMKRSFDRAMGEQKSAFEKALSENKSAYETATREMKSSFEHLSNEALLRNQREFLELASGRFENQEKQHSNTLESKKALIDQSLHSMSQSMTETLNQVPSNLKENQNKVTEVLDKSTEALKETNQNYLNQLTEKAETQTKEHIADLEAKKKLIDQQLEQMSSVLNTVPTELEKNQKNVSDLLGKSTEDLKESNQNYLNQLTEKAETQTKEHNKELGSKKELIDQRLTEMDVKLGKVEQLVQELQTDRKAQYSALGQQLQSLTHTAESLQQALADNRARGQWGERMAEDMLHFMGLVEGVNYRKQTSLESGSRPDFTFLLPNKKQLNMDAKFPLDNYMLYFSADSDAEKKEYSQKFLRDVSQRIAEIQKRGYISAETLDCVIVFIPNEQVYRFIHEQDDSIIDKALRQKVILCSPLTLYIVLAVIHQAAQNFNIEQRSREIVSIVEEIRFEWGKYSKEMESMGKNFATLHNKFNKLTVTRSKALDRKFDKIEHIVNSNEALDGEPNPLLIPER